MEWEGSQKFQQEVSKGSFTENLMLSLNENFDQNCNFKINKKKNHPAFFLHSSFTRLFIKNPIKSTIFNLEKS